MFLHKFNRENNITSEKFIKHEITSAHFLR